MRLSSKSFLIIRIMNLLRAWCLTFISSTPCITQALRNSLYQIKPWAVSVKDKRCYGYETLHRADLYHDCVKDRSSKIAKIMKLNGRIRRMDSFMIESNIRFLSCMELIYTCISKLVVYLTIHKNYLLDSLPGGK